jgi:hypothetical protein
MAITTIFCSLQGGELRSSLRPSQSKEETRHTELPDHHFFRVGRDFCRAKSGVFASKFKLKIWDALRAVLLELNVCCFCFFRASRAFFQQKAAQNGSS